MIPNNKWVKPEKYDGSDRCWVAKDGIVYCAFLSEKRDRFFCVSSFMGFPSPSSIESKYVDGVCERKDGEEKPELR